MTSKILLVEDSPEDQDLIQMSLREGGLANEVVVAEDGREALDYLFGEGRFAGRSVKDAPAVVMLDLKLPRVDGLEVLRSIRGDERTKLQPVVILTSSDEDRDRAACYALGANSYVRKPVDFDEFRRAVKEVKLYWLLVNVPPAV